MSRGKKVVLGVVVTLALVVVGLAIVIPLVLDVDRYRPEVAARLQQETGKPARIGHLALTVFPQISIRVDDFSLGNPRGFPSGNFVKAKRLYAAADPFALLHRRIEISSIELDDPDIHLLSDTHGKWNFENPPSKDAAPAETPHGTASFALGVISKVTVKRGQVVVADLTASGTPGPSLMEVHGASIELRQVDLNALMTTAALRPAASPAGGAQWPGLLGSVAYAAAPEAPIVAQGTLQADTLQFGTFSVTKLKSKLRLYPKQVFVDDLDLKCYSGDGTGNLSLDFSGANLRYTADAKLKGVNVAQFLNSLPEARGKMTGTLDGTAKLNGELVHSPDPLAGIRGSGQVSVRNGELPSLQLNRNLRMLARLANLGPANGDPSSFSSISTDFNIADGKLASHQIALAGNGVDVDGSGVMSMAGEGSLDYQGTAKIAAGSNPLTNVLAGLSGATYADGKLAFPFTLGGDFANPKFALKGGATGQTGAAGLLKSGQKPADVVRGLTGLFKKKNTQ